ncbi:MAG: response regulator [Candidatus Eisenbacteria bacterium]|nr:response regulator [Candidatus Eisenbacteria bacterium]
MTDKTRILIVDDHPIVRRGLTKLLNSETGLEVCGEAEDAATAMERVQETMPDLVIVDISLKDVGGIELIKQIKAKHPNMKMLVSSMHDEVLYAERCLHAGAMGYISKSEATEEMVNAIRRVMTNKVYLSPQMSERVLDRMVRGEDKIDRPTIESLSDRELEVFELIGRGLTTRQIAQRLYLSVKTIETYRENLKTKLGLKNSTELVRHAVRWLENQ